MKNELKHYGILGQHWGIRRYQNPDGTYTEEGLARLRNKDTKWAKKNYDKIYKETYKKSRFETNEYVVNDLNRRTDITKYNSNGKLSFTYVNEYNKKLAEIMTKNASDIKSPNLEQTIQFVAKRGAVGVEMVLAEQNANVQEIFKNGVYSNGRFAYKQKYANVA